MKRTLALLLAVAFTVVSMAGCSSNNQAVSSTGAAASTASAASKAPTSKNYRVGFTCNDLTNPTFADVATSLKKLGAKENVQVTTLDCTSNASKQITQVENFIQTGVNAIIIQSADATALKSVLKKARDKGIKVVSWDDDLGDSDDVAWVLKNYELGVIIGTAAAKWNNEKLGGKGEVALLDYPSLPICVERTKGITDTIAKLTPNAKIVAEASTLNVAQGMANTETILRAHPNVKIIVCDGDGDAIGAVQAAKAAGKNSPDFGTFSADGTDQALSGMLAGDPIRMTVSYGTGDSQATQLLDIVMKLLKGEKVDKVIYKTLTPVTIANVKDFYKK